MLDEERVPALLADIARFAASARRVVERGHARFADPDDDEQRRIACSLVLDLSTAAARLPLSFREAHPEVIWERHPRGAELHRARLRRDRSGDPLGGGGGGVPAGGAGAAGVSAPRYAPTASPAWTRIASRIVSACA